MGRLSVRIHLEQLRPRPDFDAVSGHVDWHIAKQGDAMCPGIASQLVPLPVEKKLLKLDLADRFDVFDLGSPDRLGVAPPQWLRPAPPWTIIESFLQRLEKRERAEPVARRSDKGDLFVAFGGGGGEAKTFECLFQAPSPGIPATAAIQRVIGEPPGNFRSQVYVDQAGVSGVCRFHQVGRERIVDGTQRQGLPDAEARGAKKVNEPVCVRPQHPEVEWAGKGSGMQQDAGPPAIEYLGSSGSHREETNIPVVRSHPQNLKPPSFVNIMGAVNSDAPIFPADQARLLEGTLHDPFRVLGLHTSGNGTIVVRAFLPGTESAEIVEVNQAMKRVTNDLFEWRGPESALSSPYRIRSRVDGVWIESFDPYCFPPQLSGGDLAAFGHGEHFRAQEFLGSHPRQVQGVDGVVFAVWAPEAARVSVVGDFNNWDGRCHPMRVREASGVWELFLPGRSPGELYKYEIRNRLHGTILLKADPFARQYEYRPRTASVIADGSAFEWGDADWVGSRAGWKWIGSPVSIYELHLGSWRRTASGEFLSYTDIADSLVDYVRDAGFTHVELLPVTEHPLDASWGYQATGYFAPTGRFGEPDDLRYLVDRLHREGIGVVLDWVPGHFPRDAHGLARFDGSALFEYGDPRKGEHAEWGTLVFNYGRNEVRSFLISSALFWLGEFHFDGLRVDAVAAMLYLDYGREDGEWVPNVHGGNENLDAVYFLRRLNEATHGQFPGSLTIAEESTAWPAVTRPTDSGGLGFSMKWNMGWMHDTLDYVSKNPVHRKHHHHRITFGPIYAFSENFVLPLSHDEVVHGKRSLLGKMPGDAWQRFANLRLTYTFQWTFPGKKLLFMGSEFAQSEEWDHAVSLPWHLGDLPAHSGVRQLVRDLNRLYRSRPALYKHDFESRGFQWLRWDDADNSILGYLRRCDEGDVVVLLNFTPVPRIEYRVGVPKKASYREVFNGDSRFYGGSDVGNPLPMPSEPHPWMDQPDSIVVTLPPLGGIILEAI